MLATGLRRQPNLVSKYSISLLFQSVGAVFAFGKECAYIPLFAEEWFVAQQIAECPLLTEDSASYILMLPMMTVFLV